MHPCTAIPAPRFATPHPGTPRRISLSTVTGMATRNLFRHRRRTILNVIGIGVTVSALLFFQAFYRGSYEQLMFGTIVDYQTAHVLVQGAGFIDEDPDSYCTESTMIADWRSLCDGLAALPGIVAGAPRLLAPAFAGDGIRKRSVLLAGIAQARERRVLKTLDRLSAGNYMTGPGQILVGASLARLFGLLPGDQMRIQVRTVDNVPNIQAFTIAGLFVTGYEQIDRGMMFADLPDVQELTSAGDRVNRILLRASPVGATGGACTGAAEYCANRGRTDGGGIARLTALPWTVPAAGLIEHSRGDRFFMLVFFSILFVLALVTVAGTMHMAVFERTREIGTLRAMGWHRPEVFRLFVIEAALIGAAGTLLGILVGGTASLLLAWFPIDLRGAFASLDVPLFSMTARLGGQDTLLSAAAGICSAVIAGIAPARRASRMRIVKALATR